MLIGKEMSLIVLKSGCRHREHPISFPRKTKFRCCLDMEEILCRRLQNPMFCTPREDFGDVWEVLGWREEIMIKSCCTSESKEDASLLCHKYVHQQQQPLYSGVKSLPHLKTKAVYKPLFVHSIPVITVGILLTVLIEPRLQEALINNSVELGLLTHHTFHISPSSKNPRNSQQSYNFQHQ